MLSQQAFKGEPKQFPFPGEGGGASVQKKSVFSAGYQKEKGF